MPPPNKSVWNVRYIVWQVENKQNFNFLTRQEKVWFFWNFPPKMDPDEFTWKQRFFHQLWHPNSERRVELRSWKSGVWEYSTGLQNPKVWASRLTSMPRIFSWKSVFLLAYRVLSVYEITGTFLSQLLWTKPKMRIIEGSCYVVLVYDVGYLNFF